MAAAPATSAAALAAALFCAAVFVAVQATDSQVDGHGHHGKPKGGDDLVARACANATAHYAGPGFTAAFCESALRSDRRGAAAKYPRDLALAAVDLARHGALDAAAMVDAALRHRSGKKGKEETKALMYLRFCGLDYDAVARAAPVCRAMVEGFEPGRRWGHHRGDLVPASYSECAYRLWEPAAACWSYTGEEEEVKKAVGKEAEVVAGLATLAKAMVDQMVGIVHRHH
ncbi:hypothetical protein ACP70R_042140 [Stipagrostis hirtigluma subsp. patula]